MEKYRSAESRWIPATKGERDAIREQLERMLATPPFSGGKRCPALLRYVVERSLDGNTPDLKERTLGVEVFGRDPNYDTNSDPIVRVTAGEIRKRIAQYYHEPGREREVRIDMAPGSYVPEFHIPHQEAAESAPPAAPAPVAPRKAPRAAVWTAAVLALVLAVAAATWYASRPARTAVDDFWAPVLDSPANVLLCVGQRRFLGTSAELPGNANPDVARFVAPMPADSPVTLFKLYYMGSQNVALHDVTTLARLSGLMQAKGKTITIVGESATTLGDLRRGPVVLVGAFNNDWTLRLTGPLRFSFERDGDVFLIRDRQNPARNNRSVDYTKPYLELGEDYALITRVLDPTTERMVVVVGGLTGYGTMAAGEFLTNRAYLDAFARECPKNWQRGNVQVVIAAKVINGNSGPPRVVDRHFW